MHKNIECKQMGMPRFLKLNYIHFAILLLFLCVADSSDVNLEVKGNLKLKYGTKNSDEQKGGINSYSDFVGVVHVKNEEQIDSSKEVIHEDIAKSYISNPLKSKEDKNQRISENSSSLILIDKDKEESGNSEGSREGIDSRRVSSKDGIEETSGSSMGVEKVKTWDQECDPSNMCVDEKKNLTACLRVPGNDSPDLSLLIQNIGTRPVNVTITAPAFVQLEETKVQLREKEDKKVKVSIAYEGEDSLIFLTTEDSRCTLDFRELIPHNSRVDILHSFNFNLIYLNNFNFTKTHCIILLALTAFLLFGCAWVYFGFHNKLSLGNEYWTVDMDLPVSGAAVIAALETNDGWDDEEAPKTPTLPATPNLSSKGLASRRLSKEGWKD